MNLGLSDKFKAAFPNTKPVLRPHIEFKGILSPHQITGFVQGEGCFLVYIGKSATKVGMRVQLIFQITQSTREIELMKSFVDYFGCGDYNN
jgi:hypothetical protein